MNIPKNERRDWSLVIFIIPLGILLIIIVGQLAIRIFPNWIVNANMQSNLDPNAPGQPGSLLQPLLPQIMTPMAWAQDYLNQSDDFSIPPFFVFEPTATASPTPTAASPSPTAPTPTATTPSPTVSATSTSGGGGSTPIASATTPAPVSGCTNPAALNYDSSATVDDGSCTYPPVSGCTDPSALNYDSSATVDDGSCTYPPISGCTDPVALNYDPSATVDNGLCTYPPSGYPSTIPTGYAQVTPPTEINTDAPDGNIGDIGDGYYVILDFSGSPIVVLGTPDNNYDLVFYESLYGSSILLDYIIIGITNDINAGYYEVFNWGNNQPDTNTNANVNELPQDASCTPVGEECDNYEIPTSELHPDPGTGILIDVDTAPAAPPPDSYNYVVIISPPGGASPPESAQVDAIVVTEVSIPPP